MSFTTTHSFSQTFTDVAGVNNLVTNLNSIERYGASVSFYDFNNDGWDDLTFARENDSILFYRNNGGSFEKISSFVYGDGQVKQVIWVDYDNDSDLDLFMTVYEERPRLFENDGSFNFTDVSISAGLPLEFSKNYGVSFADFNNDGYLDFYLANYEYNLPASEYEHLNQLYKNNTDGTFDNITLSANVGDSIQMSFQGLWFDYDNDGFLDLYVINDRYVHDNTLYRNNGDETFTDVTDIAGLGMDAQNPMTITIDDFNNDGYFDIYITNTGGGKTTKLFVNNGDSTFSEQANYYGVLLDEYSWGALWIDFDNDTWQDLYVATGHPSTAITQPESFFYRNYNGQSFTQDNSIFNSSLSAASHSVAKGDINNDGYYDIVSHNDRFVEPFLWENSGGGNNFIKITPQGTTSNHFAIGTLIKVYAQGQVFSKFTYCGENYIGQDSQHIIFGLGDINSVDSLTIKYSSGHTDVYYNPSVNTHHYFQEGDSFFTSIEQNSDTLVVCENDTILLSINTSDSVIWNTGEVNDTITVTNSGFYFAELINSFGVSYFSDTIDVEFYEMPNITSSPIDISCYGADDGMVNLTVDGSLDTSEYQITWSTSQSGSTIGGLPQGTYQYYYSDDYGCADTSTVAIEEPYPIDLQYQVQNEVFGNDGLVNILINGGTAPYQTFWDGTPQQSPFENLTAGVYELLIEDVNNCTHSEMIEVGTTLSLENQLKENEPFIYPNPIQKNYYFLKTANTYKDVSIIVFNSVGEQTGEYFYSILEAGVNKIPFENKPSGLYTIQVVNNKINQTYKVVY